MRTLVIHNPADHAPIKAVAGDFYGHAEDGELAAPPVLVCDRQPGCGCERSFVGMFTHYASTTLRVAEVEAGPDALVERCETFLRTGGWDEIFKDDDGDGLSLREVAEHLASVTAEAAAEFEPGTVVRPLFVPEKGRRPEGWSFTAAEPAQ